MVFFLGGCYTLYVDVSLATGSRILRGTFNGTAIYDCEARFSSLRWSADATRIATMTGNEIGVWDVKTATQLGSVDVTNAASIELTPNGNELMVQRVVKDVITLERYTATGVLTSSQVMPRKIYKFSDDLKRGVTVTDKLLQIWNTTNGTLVLEKTLTEPWLEKNYVRVVLNQDGSRVVYYDYSAGIVVLDVATGQAVFQQTPSVDMAWNFSDIAFQNEKLFVSLRQYTKNTGANGYIGVWSWMDGQEKLQPFLELGYSQVLPNGLFAVKSDSNKFEAWDLQTKQKIINLNRNIFNYSPNLTRSLATLSDGNFCGQQFFDLRNDLLLEQKIGVSTPEKLTLQIKSVPLYKDKDVYTVNGSLQIGTRNLTFAGEILQLCESNPPGLICQRFQAQTAAIPMPKVSPPEVFENGVKVGGFYFFQFTNQGTVSGVLSLDNRSYRLTLQSQ